MFVLPVNRDIRPPNTPWVTSSLIVVNSTLWLLPTLLGINQSWIQHYGYRPGAPSLVTLFVSMFLHIGFLHIAGNMWFLWMFAPKVEHRLGSFWFFAAYLLSGVAGQALQTLFTPGSLVPCVGASGAISGVLGMYFILSPRSLFDLQLYLGWWKIKSFPAQTRGAVGTWIAEQFILGALASATGARGGVAFWAHVGGFIGGLLCGAAASVESGAEERAAILRPAPLSEAEKADLLADTVEQPSGLTTLKLND
jgi:membrane associated rhomboid family serine protease